MWGSAVGHWIAQKFVTAGTCWVVSRNMARVVELGHLAFFFLAGGWGESIPVDKLGAL